MTRILRRHLRPSELADCYSGTRYLWASAQRAGVRCLLTEDLQDGYMLQSVRFVNPFQRANDRLIDEILLPGPRTSGIAQVKVRGLAKVRAVFTFAILAYNLVRIPKLLAAT
jgi:hypothetical protein